MVEVVGRDGVGDGKIDSYIVYNFRINLVE